MWHRRDIMLAAGALAAPAVARGQGAWPSRPVRLIVPYPPGGSNDTVARLLQPGLTAALGQSVVIENRGGGSGAVGAGETVRAAPDGHTWLLANDTIATNETLIRLPYHTAEALSYCTVVGTCPYALLAHPAQPWRDLPGMIASAKAQPGVLNYATTGVGSLAHVSATLLQQQGGFRLVHVPYRGGGPALQDALAGHVPLFMSNIVIVLPHLRSGGLRALGVSSREPARLLPGILPFAEQGFPGFEALTYWAMLGPAGMPAPILARMQAAIAQVAQEATTRSRLEEQGVGLLLNQPAQCEAFIRREIEVWGQVIRQHGIQAES